MFEAIIFDWDGTLADTKTVIVKAFQHVLKEGDAGLMMFI